jgi:excinuclease ABC subunit A
MSHLKCKVCSGDRVNEFARNIFVLDKNIADICRMPIEDLLVWLVGLNFVGQQQVIAETLLKEIQQRVTFLENV